MSINFDSLPSNKPITLQEKGTYYATIEKAEIKKGKDTSKPAYLNMLYALKTKDGKSAGKIFDALYESDHELMRYKLQRFITALKLPITSNFDLKDLCKIVVNKSFIVDITREEKEGQQPKAVIDLFTNEIYYPMSEASVLFGTSTESETEPAINAPDATDAEGITPTESDEEY